LELLFHHRFRSRQIFGVAKVFARISPNFPEKILCNFCLQILFHKDLYNLFFDVTSKKGLHVLQILGAIF